MSRERVNLVCGEEGISTETLPVTQAGPGNRMGPVSAEQDSGECSVLGGRGTAPRGWSKFRGICSSPPNSADRERSVYLHKRKQSPYGQGHSLLIKTRAHLCTMARPHSTGLSSPHLDEPQTRIGWRMIQREAIPGFRSGCIIPR